MSLRDDLERMEREDKAATPGPWVDDKRQGGCVVAPAEAHPYIAMQVDRRADAVAIASARTDRPALVEMVRLLLDKLFWESMDVGGAIDPDSAMIQEMWLEAKKKASKR